MYGQGRIYYTKVSVQSCTFLILSEFVCLHSLQQCVAFKQNITDTDSLESPDCTAWLVYTENGSWLKTPRITQASFRQEYTELLIVDWMCESVVSRSATCSATSIIMGKFSQDTQIQLEWAEYNGWKRRGPVDLLIKQTERKSFTVFPTKGDY